MSAKGVETLAEAAVALARRSFRVHPLKAGEKVPKLLKWTEQASTDVELVRGWWAGSPQSNIGVATGGGLVVLDVDVRSGGVEALQALERERGALPETLTCTTGGGGRHYYLLAPSDTRNADALGAGLELKAEGKQVVAPPSVHPSGELYRWVDPDAEIASAPEWLLELAKRSHGGNGTGNGRAGALPERVTEGQRRPTLLSLAGSMRHRGAGGDAILAALQADNNSRCDPPLPDAEVRAIADDLPGRYPAAASAPLPERTDLGNAELFGSMHEGRFLYVKERRRWLVWSAGRWREDKTGEAERAAKGTARWLLRRAADLEGDEQKQAVRWALNSQSEPRIRACLNLASTEPEFAIAADALDSDPYLLTCANGTLDLRTGELREHDPADRISLGTELPYEHDAECPRWLTFLGEIFAGDNDLIAFVRRAVGYSLTGDTREHVFFVCHGSGANGKSTFIKTVKRLPGSLATTAAFESFVRVRGDRGARNDLARLHRARMVSALESGESRRLDEAIVKSLTGGDEVAARFLYDEYFEFTPQFKLWLTTNHRPRVDGDDDAIWRRIRLIPFVVSFQERADLRLLEKLEAELPGILRWAVDGCREWQAESLNNSSAVARATSEYRQDEDVLGAFLDEKCVLTGEVDALALREVYEQFCHALGERPLKPNPLGKRLAKQGIRSEAIRGRRVYRGVSLQ